MGTHLCLVVIILAVFATTVANADIKFKCSKDAVSITWMVSAEMVPYAGRLFLGNCMPSEFKILPTGEGEVHFNYKLVDCKFARLIKGKHLLYKNELTFRPNPKPKPADYTYPIECAYKRPEGWIPPFLNPGSSVSEGRSNLVFHMALLDDQLTGIAKTNVIPLGSFMPIWAAVEQKSHQPLMLLMEECVAATTPELHPESQVHPIIGKKGCLLESMTGNSMFLPRYHSSAITLYLQSFKFDIGEEVYIHCKLVAWDPEVIDESKKACHYVKENGRWEQLDDPLSSVCNCCASTCKSRSKRAVEWGSQDLRHNSVLGPLIIVDPSDSRAHNTSRESVTAGDSN